VGQLILSLIGSRTRGEISLAVFHALHRFETWDALAEAKPAALLPLVDPVTFAERKAEQLCAALRIIKDRRGSLRLDFLTGWPVEDAQAWLRRLPGVDAKVSAAVLNFSTLRMRMLVVDCHHFRVARRLGLLSPKTPFKAAHRILMNQHIPFEWTADDLDDYHTLMKRHGQTICPHHKPLCHRCSLQDLCPTGRRELSLEDRDVGDDEFGFDERPIRKRPPSDGLGGRIWLRGQDLNL
jgi:endonuclease III